MRIAMTTMVALVLGLVTTVSAAEKKDIVTTAVEAGSFKTLAAAVKAAGLVETLQGAGPFTVFAPTDEAFGKLPEGTVETLVKPENKGQLTGILTYHVVPGKVTADKVVGLTGATTVNGQRLDIQVKDGKVFVDGAQVVTTDIECSNGVIHVIDSVVLPAGDNLVETADKAGAFGTLLAAAKAAGLAGALAGDDTFTVFAPTDEAFAKLPEGTVESLLKPENKAKLAAILKYHVVPGRVYSTDALAAGEAKTLQGGMVTIGVQEGVAKVNDAKLVKTDIDASNGVIHVIDTVILPPAGDKTSAVSPRQSIQAAIAHGAPLYNQGHADACAKVYMTTLEELVSRQDHGMCAATVHQVKTTLDKARHTTCADSQAWMLRKALDTAYASMTAAR